MKEFHEHKTQRDECPKCLADLNAVTETRGEAGPPAPGDLSVCLYCAQILVFDAQLHREAATDDYLEELAEKEPEVRKQLDLVVRTVKQRIGVKR